MSCHGLVKGSGPTGVEVEGWSEHVAVSGDYIRNPRLLEMS